MNLKHFYYRGYFDGRIKLSQPKKDSDARKKNDEVNEKAFRLKNAALTDTKNVSPYAPDQLKKYIGGLEEIVLEVQNPGLLPGIGYPHEVGYAGELKLGFGFDHVTGLPVLPGSSVKGILRSVFPQYKYEAEKPGDIVERDDFQFEQARYVVGLLRTLGLEVPADSEANRREIEALAHAFELSVFCGWDFSQVNAPKRSPMYRHDVFFDALPLRFNAQKQLLGRDALTPHTSGPLKNPIPLPFLKVMPGVAFGFYFRLQDTVIGALKITAAHKRKIFSDILCMVGAGAKTNVGYGQFQSPGAGAAPNSGARAASQQQNPVTIPAAKPAAKLPFSKSLAGKNVIGEVVSAAGENPVRFRILNVEGFEGERAVKVSDALLDKFEPGKRFELKVTRSLPEKKELEVTVGSYASLP
jgi:CRISPR-associated protein Cmr6